MRCHSLQVVKLTKKEVVTSSAVTNCECHKSGQSLYSSQLHVIAQLSTTDSGQNYKGSPTRAQQDLGRRQSAGSRF